MMKTALFSGFLCLVLLTACKPPPAPTTTPGLPPADSPSASTDPTATSPPEAPENVVVVTSTADSGPGSLRQALEDAQPYTRITFDPSVFPPDAPATITITGELPHIRASNVTLDASSAGVIVDGSQIPGDWVAGLQIVSSSDNRIMGLQISNFPGPGIAISGNSTQNVIGGNQITNNVIGVDLATSGTTQNTVTGNLIGTDAHGSDMLGNERIGVSVTEGAHDNTIGPDNTLANSGECGIWIIGPDTSGNAITRNNILANNRAGICLQEGGNAGLRMPYILSIDLEQGEVSGVSCPDCTVEIFSGGDDQGASFEGSTVADGSGIFSFSKGAAFAGPTVTATMTDAEGNTGGLARAAGLFAGNVTLQENNELPRFRLLAHPSSQLPADLRLGASLYSSNMAGDIPHLDSILDNLTDFGIKRLDTSLNENEPPINWDVSETEIPPEYDQFIDALNQNGVAVNYMIHFWDKAGHAAGEDPATPRFQTEEGVQDFLEYVRFIVDHFKGRVDYYTIWSEPDYCGDGGIKCIETQDYLNLARQTIPVIRQIDPQAKVALAPYVLYFARDQVSQIIASDVIKEFDVIQWHGIYDPVPGSAFYGNYYYEYPSIVEGIRQTATANGFQGEFWGTELTWCSAEYPTCHPADQPWTIQETDKLAAKYYTRGVVMHLGMDMGVSFGGLESVDAPWTWPTIRNLNTILAGVTPTPLDVKVESEGTNVTSYSFTLPGGDVMLALWTNNAAIEDDAGEITTVTFLDRSAPEAAGIDPLHGFEQELATETDGSDLIIRGLLVKDYPIFIRLGDPAS